MLSLFPVDKRHKIVTTESAVITFFDPELISCDNIATHLAASAAAAAAVVVVVVLPFLLVWTNFFKNPNAPLFQIRLG